ncbi:MAG: type II toxin-antitoxin system HicB family antitoxin [Gammaproteobacteria bacterium]
MTKYKVIICWSEEDQSYIAEVPELAGCVADGNSYQEAVSNAERVIAEWMDTAVELGRDIPDPKGGYMLRLYRHCCSFARKHLVGVVCIIVLIVLGFYFGNFHNGLSKGNGDWGTFGDYFGGILNPVIASFAFYLIAETYKLQKKELVATRNLLKVSTDAQKDQIKLAALTALLNSNLTRIGLLKIEKSELLNEILVKRRPQSTDTRSNEDMEPFDVGFEGVLSKEDHPRVLRFREINGEIKSLTDKNNELEEEIRDFLERKVE